MTGNKYAYLAIAAIAFIGGFLIGGAMDDGQELADNHDTIYQYSTIGSLANGIFDGDMSIGGIKAQGDIGLGTFNALDGEMVVLDGVVYQVRYDGEVLVADDAAMTPFVCVTYFEEDISIDVESAIGMDELEQMIVDELPSENLAYAIRIDGTFENMRTRSPRPQQVPYPDLVSALADQSVFDFSDIEGTIVGFWNPAYFEDFNVSGYHLHFLDDSRESGGHVLEFTMTSGKVLIDICYGVELDLPESGEFLSLDLNVEDDTIEKVEK